MVDLNKMWIDHECSRCGYQDAFQLIDAKSEKKIFCHNCKIIIQLIDSEASVHQGINNINNAFNELDKMLKNFGK